MERAPLEPMEHVLLSGATVQVTKILVLSTFLSNASFVVFLRHLIKP